MPENLYCWRCRKEVPMLTEEEWAAVEPHLENRFEAAARYCEAHPEVGLSQALEQGLGTGAQEEYARITGQPATDLEALYHHRLSLYGPPCAACGRPLRTPEATHCAECGAKREDGA